MTYNNPPPPLQQNGGETIQRVTSVAISIQPLMFKNMFKKYISFYHEAGQITKHAIAKAIPFPFVEYQ